MSLAKSHELTPSNAIAAAVRATFNSADKVDKFTVFNVGGGGYRVVTAIHFNRQKLYIRHVFTHSEYERWSTKLRK
jgi:mRNA interferase HigB